MQDKKEQITDKIEEEQKATPLLLTTTPLRKQIRETKKFLNEIKL